MKKMMGLALLLALLAGCETMQKKEAAPAAAETKATPAPVAPAVKPAAKTAAPEKKLGPKAQAQKDAADKKAAQQEAAAAAAAAKKAPADTAAPGKTQEVKGINDWSGQIVGTPFKSKFSNLKIGMGFNEAISIAGKPTDTSSHITGKAWIPFYFGSGRYETVFYYKGVGRLTFAGGAGAYAVGVNDNSGLTIIEYDKNERGFQ